MPRPARRYTSERDGLSVFRRVQEQLERDEAANPPAPAPVAVKQVAPPPPPAPAPVETVDLIRRLASPCGPEAVEAAAKRLATRLGDAHSERYYARVCEDVRSGRLPAKTLVGAFKQASSGTARVPGSVFAGFVKEHSPPGPAHKATPGATRQSPPGAAPSSKPPVDPSVSNCTRRETP